VWARPLRGKKRKTRADERAVTLSKKRRERSGKPLGKMGKKKPALGKGDRFLEKGGGGGHLLFSPWTEWSIHLEKGETFRLTSTFLRIGEKEEETSPPRTKKRQHLIIIKRGKGAVLLCFSFLEKGEGDGRVYQGPFKISPGGSGRSNFLREKELCAPSSSMSARTLEGKKKKEKRVFPPLS